MKVNFSKWVTTLFLLAFLSFWIFMGYRFTKGFCGLISEYFWIKTECTILASEVIDRTSGYTADPYVARVKYKYYVDSQEFIANRKEEHFSDYSNAQQIVDTYKPGIKTICYVNRSNPGKSILEHGSLWTGLTLFIPLIFILFTIGVLYLVWNSEKIDRFLSDRRSISSNKKRHPYFLAVFFSIFLIIGIVVFVVFFIRPAVKIISARNWVEVPCNIISSRILEQKSNDGHTHSIDILYSYNFGGKLFRSNRYDFLGGSFSTTSPELADVQKYKQGTTRVCYVNPRDPLESVLNRGFLTIIYGLGVFGLIFTIVGGAGVIYARGFAKKVNSISMQDTPVDGTTKTDLLILKPRQTPLARFVLMIFFALFWNGMIILMNSHSLGSVSLMFKSLFSFDMIIFTLVGIGLILMVFYFFLGLFNPYPRIMLNPATISLGDKIEVRWDIAGKINRIKKLRIFLEGREKATYKFGDTTNTDKKVFFVKDVVNMNTALTSRSGATIVSVPIDTMHTLKAEHNKILWAIKVQGNIRYWPDMAEEFEINIHPIR